MRHIEETRCSFVFLNDCALIANYTLSHTPPSALLLFRPHQSEPLLLTLLHFVTVGCELFSEMNPLYKNIIDLLLAQG